MVITRQNTESYAQNNNYQLETVNSETVFAVYRNKEFELDWD